MISLQALLENPHIGSDETLKGDTFGGLVVCACYFNASTDSASFASLGVKDSKLLSDKQIRLLAPQLLSLYPSHFSCEVLLPKEYNTMLLHQNQTAVLNLLHDRVAHTLRERFGMHPHLVDEFPGCHAGDISEKRAEHLSLAVAAASIVARYKGLLQFEQLSKQAGFILPMGSTHVSEALHKLIRRESDLSSLTKLHFKNVQEALLKDQNKQKKLSERF